MAALQVSKARYAGQAAALRRVLDTFEGEELDVITRFLGRLHEPPT